MSFKTIKENYVNKQQKCLKLKAKVELKQRQIYRLENRIDKERESNWWGDNLIRPMMELVKAKYPLLSWDDERLVPMGMRNAVSVFGKLEGETIVHITFTPGNVLKGELWFDTGETKSGYQRGSIGELNGMQNIEELIEDEKQIFKYLDKQILSLVTE